MYILSDLHAIISQCWNALNNIFVFHVGPFTFSFADVLGFVVVVALGGYLISICIPLGSGDLEGDDD